MRDKIGVHIFGNEEEWAAGKRKARERMVRGSCGECSRIALELQAERARKPSKPAGIPPLPGEDIGSVSSVSDERAGARNLGGTAKQPFALNRGKGCFYRIQVFAEER